MGKPTKRTRLSAKASPVERKTRTSQTADTSPELSSIPIQRTKDEKRQVRHDAFLKSSLFLAKKADLEIKDKKKTKRRQRPKKLKVNLSAIGASLDDIIAEDRKTKSRKMEVGVRPKGQEIRNEIDRFKAVLEHPEFKANPLKTIRQYVENTWDKKEGMA